MKDTEIIKLYFERSERAISQTADKYSAYLFKIAFNILKSRDDAEEIVNDTYRAAWDSMPPENPSVLRHYLSRITRNLSLKRLEYRSAGKRSSIGDIAIDELEEFIPDSSNVESIIEAKELGKVINSYLSTLPEEDVTVFTLRYFYVVPIREVARRCGISERAVKYRLSRLRNGLKDMLRKEGY